MESAIREEIARVVRDGVTPAEAEKARTQIEAEVIFDRDSTDQVAASLSEAIAAANWAWYADYPAAIRRVTPEDVQRVARTYLNDEDLTVGVFLPKPEGGETPAPPPGPEDQTRSTGRRPDTRAARAWPSPRSCVPVAEAVRRRARGRSGVRRQNHLIRPSRSPGSPTRDPPAPPGRRLIASMTAGSWQGPEARSPDRGNVPLARRGSAAFDRMVEIPLAGLPAEELEKEKKRAGRIRQQQDPPGVRPTKRRRGVHPPEHPSPHGPERIALVEAWRARTRPFYWQRYGAGTLQSSWWATFPLTDPDGLRTARVRHRGPNTALTKVPVPPASPARETVSMPDKASADVVILEPSTLTRADPAFLACTLANSALGQSSLTSRLGVRVRDIEGLTYGIHSSFHAPHVAGPFVITVTVKPESRDAAVASTLDEVARFLKTGLTKKELEEEKSSRIGKFQVDLASNAGIAQALDAAVYYDLGLDYLDRFPALVQAITREEADAEFRKRVHPDRFTIVSAGSFPSGSS